MSIASDIAHVPVRWSWLSRFALSPLHARHAALHGTEPTAAMRLGTAAHAVIFDERVAVYHGAVRRGKEWDAFSTAAAEAGVLPVSAKEYEKASAMRAALRAHPVASPILFGPGVLHEQTIRWQRMGRECSSRPDARKPGQWIVDLKTARSAEPGRFMRAAQWSGYPGQMAFYREADCFERGRPPESLGVDLYIVAIEPFEPYAISVFQLDGTAREFGERSVTACWETLRRCEESNDWPGYSESAIPFVIDGGWFAVDDLDDTAKEEDI